MYVMPGISGLFPNPFPVITLPALYHKGLTLQTTFSQLPSQLKHADRILKGKQMEDIRVVLPLILISGSGCLLQGPTPTGQPCSAVSALPGSLP